MSTNFSNKRSKNKKEKSNNFSLELKIFDPLTLNQKKIFESFDKKNNILIHGYPGTGKSFISLYLALDEILNGKKYNKLVIFRSSVQTRNQGFMPGNLKEKSSYYEDPYRKICAKLFGRDDAYDILKEKNIIEFSTTSFLRSLTFDNSIMFLDEAQNCDYNELKTVITRIGENSRLIICGDVLQDDLTSERYNEESGLQKIMKILLKMKMIDFHEMTENDIVRSEFVKEFIVKEIEFLKQEKKLNENKKAIVEKQNSEFQSEESYDIFARMEMFRA